MSKASKETNPYFLNLEDYTGHGLDEVQESRHHYQNPVPHLGGKRFHMNNQLPCGKSYGSGIL